MPRPSKTINGTLQNIVRKHGYDILAADAVKMAQEILGPEFNVEKKHVHRAKHMLRLEDAALATAVNATGTNGHTPAQKPYRRAQPKAAAPQSPVHGDAMGTRTHTVLKALVDLKRICRKYNITTDMLYEALNVLKTCASADEQAAVIWAVEQLDKEAPPKLPDEAYSPFASSGKSPGEMIDDEDMPTS